MGGLKPNKGVPRRYTNSAKMEADMEGPASQGEIGRKGEGYKGDKENHKFNFYF